MPGIWFADVCSECFCQIGLFPMFAGGSGIEHRGCSFVGVAANDVGVRAHTEPAVRENTSATVKACSSQWNWDFRPCRLQAVRNNLRRVGGTRSVRGANNRAGVRQGKAISPSLVSLPGLELCAPRSAQGPPDAGIEKVKTKGSQMSRRSDRRSTSSARRLATRTTGVRGSACKPNSLTAEDLRAVIESLTGVLAARESSAETAPLAGNPPSSTPTDRQF